MGKVIILLGPTGVGKTAVSILIARHLDTEVISADSMQIYKHMDIGTAKPSIEEQQVVKHHMIDIVEPWEHYSTGEYIKAVRPILENLQKDKKIPIIVGGTGLYIKAMTRGIFKGPSADWDLRNKLLEIDKGLPGYLYEYLKSLDPVAASKIMPADTRRIIRALEVCLKTNSVISEMHQLLTQPLPYEFIKIGITRDRKELYRMIEQRVDKMINAGLVDEVKNVIQMIKEHFSRSGLNSSLSSMQAIGYKEIAAHLDGELSLDEAITLIKKRSKNYAKRQFTWFKKEDDIKWINATGIQDPSEMFKKVLQFIHA
ncbi:tRNA dimethylallyltransferase [Dissulfurispira thermophila]|uniref:tRNA dimethylallyltransferase n=1 Tax=Dissulfurispira thermophila TaxID=2715679 RepID=A0A7G1H3S2_9BACT|nr:tRNA (adenosine(37)-N6)-dimethylallyltransferase MiaA [Dissulfurispira thermophila]BCB97368.1 tRNA dimethylallyltransferase [Dissulfurispira thermophila]